MLVTSNQQNMSLTRTSSILKELQKCLLQFNVYNRHDSLSIREQIIATRLYTIFIVISLFGLFIFSASNLQIRRFTLNSPSLSQFEFLSEKYPSTLSCPCSQVTVPYKNFLSFSPQYHQICSSDFTTQSWISALFSINTTDYFQLDFRTSSSSQFQVLTLMCNTIGQFISNILKDFSTQYLITSHSLSRVAFNAQIAALVQQLETRAVIDITNMDPFVSSSMSQNHLVSALHTNYFIYSVPGTRYYTTWSSFYSPVNFSDAVDNNLGCDCEYTYECVAQSGIFNTWALKAPFYYLIPDPPPIFSVPGILAGCVPRFSIFQSTLECFYNLTCLKMIQMFIDDISFRHPLDINIKSRFQFNATIQSIFSKLFIEEWHNESNFTNYFSTCAPKSCSYTYTQRFYIAYVFLTLFSLLGGLTVALDILAPFIIENIIRPLQLLLRNRRIQRLSVSSDNNEIRRESM